MTKSDLKYYTKRVIAAVLIFVVLSLIKSCDVKAATCETLTINTSYYYNSTWTNFYNNPNDFTNLVDKISIIYNNANIQNKAVIFNGKNNVITFGSHVENPIIRILLKDDNSEQDITNRCVNNINRSCYQENDNICIYTNYIIETNCNFTSTMNNANKIEIQYSSNLGIKRFYFGTRCIQINPTDTQQIIESQNNNTDDIIENMNDNADKNHNDLNDIENAIEEMFPNFGSCRKMGHVILTKNKALDSNGNEVDNNNYGISGMIRVYPTDTLDRMKPSNDNVYACFYGNMNQLIECQTERQVINYQIPADAYYVRFTWSQIDDSPETYHCSKDDQMVQNAIDEAADSINKFREEYNNSQQVCEIIDKNDIKIDNKYLNASGIETENEYTFGTTNYIDITNSSIQTIAITNNSVYLCFYDKGKNKISCINENTFNLNENINIPNNAKYVRFSIRTNYNIPQYKICKNGNQGIYQFLTPSSVDSVGVGSSFSNFDQHLANTGVITNLLTLPVSFFTKVLNSLNTQCITFNLGSLLGTNISFPCIDVESYLGTELWSVIDVLLCGFFVYRIGKQIIKVFLNLSSLKEGDVLDG